MPKILENPGSRLIAEARRQIGESGCSAMTIRPADLDYGRERLR